MYIRSLIGAAARHSIVRISIVGICCSGFVAYSSAYANDDETIEACEQAAKLLAEDDIDGALEEASWCLEGIQQRKQQQTLAVFPEEVDGFAGGETNAQKVMGVKMIERTYTKADQSIEVSLMGGGPASTGLAALAQLGLSVGEGGKKMRIQRRTVVDMSSGDSVDLMVKMKSGGMLTIKSSNTALDSVVAFTKSFPIKELDESLEDN